MMLLQRLVKLVNKNLVILTIFLAIRIQLILITKLLSDKETKQLKIYSKKKPNSLRLMDVNKLRPVNSMNFVGCNL